MAHFACEAVLDGHYVAGICTTALLSPYRRCPQGRGGKSVTKAQEARRDKGSWLKLVWTERGMFRLALRRGLFSPHLGHTPPKTDVLVSFSLRLQFF